MPQRPKNIVIIGGGAAGYFLAANLFKNPNYSVTLIEKSADILQKVKVSGGGRCNVTHAEFIPSELVKNYPRGEKELRSVFSKFQPADTFEWFQSRGVELKIEEDNRVFPLSNSSQTIIDIFTAEANKNGAKLITQEAVQSVKIEGETFKVQTTQNEHTADYLVITSGSSPSVWKWIESDLHHTIVPPVPSLFTFNCKDPILQDLSGTSFPNAEVQIPQLKLDENGPLLITHWGLSGPAILKLSAFGARELAALNYQFTLHVNWLGENQNKVETLLLDQKKNEGSQSVAQPKLFPTLTKRFWHRVLYLSGISLEWNWAEVPNEKIQNVSALLCATQLQIKGKSTFKEEFVTAGGIDLKEINFKNMESKLHSNLYFAGEVLNIDAITGGFNFQACWSEAFLIAEDLKSKLA